VVEMSVFDDFAMGAVKDCAESLKRGKEFVEGLDGELFLIKHLLLLREQLIPFDIQLRSTSKTLDFTQTGAAFARFMTTSKLQLFDLSLSTNSLIGLGTGVVGTVKEEEVDGRGELEEVSRAEQSRAKKRQKRRMRSD